MNADVESLARISRDSPIVTLACHPRESGGPGRVTVLLPWIPAFAGMTMKRAAWPNPYETAWSRGHPRSPVGAFTSGHGPVRRHHLTQAGEVEVGRGVGLRHRRGAGARLAMPTFDPGRRQAERARWADVVVLALRRVQDLAPGGAAGAQASEHVGEHLQVRLRDADVLRGDRVVEGIAERLTHALEAG